ncbi:PE domain-containing protein [Nocardia australiensis]|uniref:PE domain-containing protein n=1 Tax=Nocardia australiensis TaxID=2887191 RepID=UPI001D157714|nr:PE domain-containing protein [Nocardia australiensis]
MALNISPEQLSVVSAQLFQTGAVLASAVGSWAPAAVPMPAAIDDVSVWAATQRAEKSIRFADLSVPGFEEVTNAATALPKVAATYLGTDGAGGASVDAQAANFV